MSKNGRNVEKGYIFEGRILEFERDLLEYNLEIAKFHEQSITLASIMAYLTIHGKLTQRQLKTLTNFSISTISTKLANLVNIGYVRKEIIRGKHEFIYFPSTPEQDSFDQALGSMKKEIYFLQNKIKLLSNDIYYEKKGKTFFFNKLNEIIQTFQKYQEIIAYLKDLSTNLQAENNKKENKNISRADFFPILDEFDPEIKKIEEEIISFFMHESAYSTLKYYTFLTYMYFFTRGILTQDKLRDLTGLSAGKISQILNSLVKNQSIDIIDKDTFKSEIPNELLRKKIYTMSPFQTHFMRTSINGLTILLNWEDRFKKIKSELNSKKEELENLNGYNEVVKIVNEYLNLMQIYQQAHDIFLKFL